MRLIRAVRAAWRRYTLRRNRRRQLRAIARAAARVEDRVAAHAEARYWQGACA